jgi:heme exporter protein C
MRSTATRLVPILLGLSAVMFAAAPYVIDTAPYEATMGLVQRIFYFHLPAAWVMLLAAITCGVASGLYLWKRGATADAVAVATAELAVVVGAIVLVTGPLWARRSWNTWWVWEARITSTFVMWMVFNAYVLLRRFGGPGSEVLSAAVGVFGMALVPFIYWSVNMWRTLHPQTTVVPTLPVDMGRVLLWCFIAFVVWSLALLILRVRLESARRQLDEAYLMVED